MSNYDNNMSGALFKNDKRQTENHPNYRGSCEINNEQYWVSAWVKKDKNGNAYMSLSFQPKEQPAQVAKVEAVEEFDDLPF